MLLLQFQPASRSDESCFFRTSLRGGAPSLANYDAVISKAHSNASHELILSGWSANSASPVGQLVKIGQEQENHQFMLDSVEQDELFPIEKISDVEKISDLTVPSRRLKYCQRKKDEWEEEQRKRKKKKKKKKRKEKQKQKKDKKEECDSIRDIRKRVDCRKVKESKCLETRIARGKSPMEQPCNAHERKWKRMTMCHKACRKDGYTRKACKACNCDKLRPRSNRKECKRLKRKNCRKGIKEKFPEFKDQRIVGICKAKQRIQSCSRKRMVMIMRRRKIKIPIGGSASLYAIEICARREERKLKRTRDKRIKKGRKWNPNKMKPEDIKLLRMMP